MILAINTAQPMHELAIFDGEELLIEREWEDDKNDVEILPETIAEMLEEHGLEKSQITDILVISGPGPFTGIRTGVAFANTLAEGLGAKLYAMDTFEMLKRKAAAENTIVVLNAGGLDVGVRHESKTTVGPISTILAKIPHGYFNVISETTETQSDELHSICIEKGWNQIEGHELQSLGEILLSFGLDGLQPTEIVDVLYLKDPVITKSSNKWKQ